MTTRILPVEEWSRLAHTEACDVHPFLDPDRSSVVVVEQDGAIVGCHILINVVHAECLWIDPAFRGKTSVARRLWAAVQAQARELGARTIATAACDDQVRELLAHVGATKLPGDHYVIPVQG